MKSILSICALFLVLPWKLTGETTVRPSSTRQYEDTSKVHETTPKGDEPTIFSTKIGLSVNQNGETSYSPSSTKLHKSISKDHETTLRGEKSTISSTNNADHSLKPNGETTHSSSRTGMQKSTSKDHETTTRDDEPTSVFLKNQTEHTTEESKNVLSSTSPPQTSEHQQVSRTEYITHAMSTGDSRSSSLMSSPPFMTEMTQKKSDLITSAPLPQNVSEEVITTKDDHQTLDHFKSTNEGLDRHTREKKTTRSAEKESYKTETDILTHLTNTPQVTTNQASEIRTTKWSLTQEKESTHLPILNITDSNGILNIGKEERNGTATYPLNTSTTTSFSFGLSPTVNTEVVATSTTETMDANATYQITTKAIIGEKTYAKPVSKTIPTTRMDTTKSAIAKKPMKDDKDDNKSQPGPIVAALIGTILFIMLVAFVVILVRNQQKKKKQMENSDWAGPSPFIEADIHPNEPNINEDRSFHPQESKRISLYSFLPQQLSKRFSMLSPTEEEIPLENTHPSSTFGQHNIEPVNGNATSDQIQEHEANSPPAELSSDNIPETTSIPPAPENNENLQTTTKIDEVIPSSPADTNSVTPTPFEDVDLNLSLDTNTETTPPSDAVDIPSPPSLAPS